MIRLSNIVVLRDPLVAPWLHESVGIRWMMDVQDDCGIIVPGADAPGELPGELVNLDKKNPL